MKVMKQLLQFLSQSIAFQYLLQHPELIVQVIVILLKVKEISMFRLTFFLTINFRKLNGSDYLSHYYYHFINSYMICYINDNGYNNPSLVI